MRKNNVENFKFNGLIVDNSDILCYNYRQKTEKVVSFSTTIGLLNPIGRGKGRFRNDQRCDPAFFLFFLFD